MQSYLPATGPKKRDWWRATGREERKKEKKVGLLMESVGPEARAWVFPALS
ncbi:hypothetical protein K0M31_015372 [Melipona bicolor]|uniref:Uncharacterized protein n=1 Tax=Melipona bicolor TaxID=60889 RepID=A0AA40FFJ8_9HYME|nr:hypothetical protein K0M31_015372 [Melipona bicolor]